MFVEEMTKAVMEAGPTKALERAVTAIPASSVAFPASLHASLMARLDRLGSAKEVAQIGSVIGREFSHSLLMAVGRTSLKLNSNRRLTVWLKQVCSLARACSRTRLYLFKHALVQDAAYGTLLREPRRALHARIADALEGHFEDTAENQPELLARHYTEAGMIEKAAAFWGKAGQRSLERSALLEAVAQLTRALDQLAGLPSTPGLRREQIRLQVALITPLLHVKGYAFGRSQGGCGAGASAYRTS